MAKITYVSADGTRTELDVDNGQSVMQAAVDNGVEGIVAECGGTCSCATCHVHVDPAWFARLNPPENVEREMLDFAIDPSATSRLSCQIRITNELDGLVVHTPVSQY